MTFLPPIATPPTACITPLTTLSRRRLVFGGLVVSLCFIVILILGFLCGGNRPRSSMSILATKCLDDEIFDGQWFWSRGEGRCRYISHREEGYHFNDIVYVFQLPLPRGGQDVYFSNWQTDMRALLDVDASDYSGAPKPNGPVPMELFIRLAYRNHDDMDDQWKEVATTRDYRIFSSTNQTNNYPWEPLFALNGLHDFYLLNVRLIFNAPLPTYDLSLLDLWMTFSMQNGSVMKLWVSLKAVFLPLMLAALCWHSWRRHSHPPHPKPLLQVYITMLLLTLILSNFPLEYLSTVCSSLWVEAVIDIRDWLVHFLTLRLCFLFIGVHMKSNDGKREKGWRFWLALMATWSAFGFLYVLKLKACTVSWLRGSIWLDRGDARLAFTFIVAVCLCAALYFVLVAYTTFKAVEDLDSTLQSMENNPDHWPDAVIESRVKVVLVSTLVVATLTIITFTMSMISDVQWTFDYNNGWPGMVGFYTGVYGMVNLYVLVITYLNAPGPLPTPIEESKE